jgi:hypothetical protein
MKKILFLLQWSIAFVCAARGQTAKFIPSPDGRLRAQIISVAFDNVERNYDIVKIERGADEITEYPLLQNSRGMARSVLDCQWSPDSRFFVFITKDIAGHSIWHSPTTLYDSQTGKFWELDQYIGDVVDEKVHFTAPDVLSIQVANPKLGAIGPPVTKRFSLSKWEWNP